MRKAMVAAAVGSCLCAGLWGQAGATPSTSESPDVMNPAANHAKDPVGFESSDAPDPQNRDSYPDEVVSAIQTRWYQVVSEFRQTSYDQQGVAIVEFRVNRDGSLGKVAIVQRSKEDRIDNALNAVRSSSPFKPIPKESISKSIGLRVHLGYNQPIPGDPCPTTFPGIDRVHDGITNLRAIHSPDPEYSEDARKVKYQGTAAVGLTVGGDGLPYDVCVVNALGHGLDEKSLEAVKQWKFEPAVKDGRTVPVRLSVETSFRLY